MSTVRLTHPKRGRSISVPEDRADTYRAVGWVDQKTAPAANSGGGKKKGGTAPRSTGKDET